MKQEIAVLLAGCLAAVCGGASETAQQRGKRVVYEALAALGGDAYLHMEDRVESGRAYSFYREQIQGMTVAKIYTRYLAPVPGKLSQRERQVFFKNESDIVLFTEENAWEITFHGAKPLEAKRYATYKDGVLRNIFYILRQRLNEPGMDFYSRGADLYENRPVEIVDITDAANQTVTVYFNQLSKLPERQIFKRRNEEYKDFDTEVSTFANYHNVNGVKWPISIRRERNGDKIFEMYSDSVEINKDLKDDLFTLPTKFKMPAKAK